MNQLKYDFLVGIDLGQWLHMAVALDAKGEFVGERSFPHSREGLSETIDWLLQLTTQDTERIAVTIEKPHGAVVELFLDNAIAIFSINPKQVDRFRDRHSMSGAKDDRRDAFVLADSLRTDGHRFQRLQLPPPEILAMRGLLSTRDQLVKNHVALSSQSVNSLLVAGLTSSRSRRRTRLSTLFSASSSSSSSNPAPTLLAATPSRRSLKNIASDVYNPRRSSRPSNKNLSGSRPQPHKLLPSISNCSFSSYSSFDNIVVPPTSISRSGSSACKH